jgi:hypothetical protein
MCYGYILVNATATKKLNYKTECVKVNTDDPLSPTLSKSDVWLQMVVF